MEPVTSYIMKNSNILNKMENQAMQKQVEVVKTLLPDVILNLEAGCNAKEINITGFILIGELHGLTTLCEEYNKTNHFGIRSLMKILDNYISIILECIHFYSGDLVKFSSHQLVAIWKVEENKPLQEATYEVLTCITILRYYTRLLESDIKISLKLRLGLNYGLFNLVILESVTSDFFLWGNIIDDLIILLIKARYGECVLDPKIILHLDANCFMVDRTRDVILLNNVLNYFSDIKIIQKESVILSERCQKIFNNMKGFIEHSGHDKLHRNLTEWPLSRNLLLRQKYNYCRNFLIPPLYNQIDNNAQIEELSGYHEVIIQYVYIKLDFNDDSDFFTLAHELFNIASDIVYQLWGVLSETNISKSSISFTSYFGLTAGKSYIPAQNALRSSLKIKNSLASMKGIAMNAITVMTSSVFIGIVGHTQRKVCLTIGYVFHTLHQIAKKFERKITVDFKTFKKSKLSSEYFSCLPSSELKVGIIMEFDTLKSMNIENHNIPRLIGRNEEFELILDIVSNPQNAGSYLGVCFYGKANIGKTAIIQRAFHILKEENLMVPSVILPDGPQRPYFCISQIYRQIYDSHAKLDSDHFELIKDHPSEFWDYRQELEYDKGYSNYLCNKKLEMLRRFQSILVLQEYKKPIIFIDNVEYIDIQSLEILKACLFQKTIFVICGGSFQDNFAQEIKWHISLCENMKLYELDELPLDFSPILIAKFLGVEAVSETLNLFLQKNCGGNPGFLKMSCTYLLNKGLITIEILSIQDEKLNSFIIIDDFNVKFIENIKVANFPNKEEKPFIHDDTLYNLMLTFSPNIQSLITIATILGSIFKRDTLVQLLNDLPQGFFACAFMKLFEANIFECGTKYLTKNSFLIEPCSCECPVPISNNNKGADVCLPKFAHCQLILFKNRHLKNLVQNIIDIDEKKQLHFRISSIIEEQCSLCGFCENSNFICTFIENTFNDFAKHLQPSTKLSLTNDLETTNSEYKIQRTNSEEIEKEINVTNYEDYEKNKTLKIKIWNSFTCLCLDIVCRKYNHLMSSCRISGFKSKRVFYMINYAKILMTLNELPIAIEMMQKAKNICEKIKNPANNTSNGIETCLSAKICRMLAESHYRIGNIDKSKKLISYSLSHFKLPDATYVSYSFFQKLLSKTVFKKCTKTLSNTKRDTLGLRLEMSSCFHVANQVLATEKNKSLSKLVGLQSLLNLIDDNKDLELLCNVYADLLDAFAEEKPEAFNTMLEGAAMVVFSLNKNMWDVKGIFAATALSVKVVELKFLSGKIMDTIPMGYQVIEMCKKIGALRLLAYSSAMLSTFLLWVQRIQDAIEIMNFIFNIGKTQNSEMLTFYYIFCLEIYLDGGILLEPLEKCVEYADECFFGDINKTKFDKYETRFIILVYCFYIRQNQNNIALKWKRLVPDQLNEISSFYSISNLFRYTECLMIGDKWKISEIKYYMADKKNMKNHMALCKKQAFKWKVFLPKYFLYCAFYSTIKHKKNIKKYFKLGWEVAKAQQNILDQCWLFKNENSYQSGFNFSQEYKTMNWRYACHYSMIQWSDLLYDLPWNG